jgi:predicted HTH domain antitoxin
MSTETVTFEVSQDLLASMKVGSAELAQDIRRLAAIAYFRSKKLSLGKAAELAGMPRLDFMDLLANQGIVVFDYDESMLKDELLGVAELSRAAHDRQ